MFKLYNAYSSPLGLPGTAGTIQPDDTLEVADERILTNPVVINWLRSGRLQLLDADAGMIKGLEIDDRPSAPAKRLQAAPSSKILEILDQSIPKIAEQLPGLTDEEFDDVIRAEKDGKTRSGLAGPGGVFDQEWARRYGIDD